MMGVFHPEVDALPDDLRRRHYNNKVGLPVCVLSEFSRIFPVHDIWFPDEWVFVIPARPLYLRKRIFCMFRDRRVGKSVERATSWYLSLEGLRPILSLRRVNTNICKPTLETERLKRSGIAGVNVLPHVIDGPSFRRPFNHGGVLIDESPFSLKTCSKRLTASTSKGWSQRRKARSAVE